MQNPCNTKCRGVELRSHACVKRYSSECGGRTSTHIEQRTEKRACQTNATFDPKPASVQRPLSTDNSEKYADLVFNPDSPKPVANLRASSAEFGKCCGAELPHMAEVTPYFAELLHRNNFGATFSGMPVHSTTVSRTTSLLTIFVWRGLSMGFVDFCRFVVARVCAGRISANYVRAFMLRRVPKRVVLVGPKHVGIRPPGPQRAARVKDIHIPGHELQVRK